ncbi:MAG: hypothetical protein HY898_24225 [Deltaproteobacteria bacterium]|nr:hypothetical protein [Deltaproteobacteria bacterium]
MKGARSLTVAALAVAALAFCGCGGADEGLSPVTVPQDAMEAAPSDAPEPEAAAMDAGAEPTDAAIEALHDAAQEGSPAAACAPDQACNALLTTDGLCPGDCIPQVHGIACKGTVSRGLCRAIAPAEPVNEVISVHGVSIVPGPLPPLILVGDSVPISITLTNTTSAAVTLSFNAVATATWEMSNESFAGMTELTLQPAESLSLTATMKAIDGSIFQGSYVMLSAWFDGVSYTLSAVSGYPSDNAIACGGQSFPSVHAPCPTCSPYQQYGIGRCCNDVFYPSSDCCSDADCPSGVCTDGRCIGEVPGFPYANTLAQGNHKALLVLSGFPEYESYAPCVNHATALQSALGLEAVETFYRALGHARAKKSSFAVQWTILAGLHDQELVAAGDHSFPAFYGGLESWIAKSGCSVELEAFDKIVIASPQLDLGGFAGQAFDRGRIGLTFVSEPFLLVHELAHTFGGDDLYTSMGGSFQYAWELMANNFGQLGPAGDGVMWGQLGFGDVDRNGVIDLFEFAQTPEGLDVTKCTARLTQKSTLEVAVELAAIEGGVAKKATILPVTVSLPQVAVQKELANGSVLVFDETEVDLAKLGQMSILQVRVMGSFAFTDASFERVKLILDETLEVPIEKL